MTIYDLSFHVLKVSATGTAMRAIANNRETAALLGVPVRKIEALAWFGSGLLCSFVFLLLPSFVKSLDQTTFCLRILWSRKDTSRRPREIQKHC